MSDRKHAEVVGRQAVARAQREGFIVLGTVIILAMRLWAQVQHQLDLRHERRLVARYGTGPEGSVEAA